MRRTCNQVRFWWHDFDADVLIPGTYESLLSFDPNTGAPDPTKEALYSAADRLDLYGFSAWIGREPHGSLALNSGCSVPKCDEFEMYNVTGDPIEIYNLFGNAA